jgi:glyoxylase-like metal-dependent hydrolase (beta-lactamase superfamily II)
VEGGGGHSGVIVGDNGVIVVDAKTTPAGGKELLEDIAKITSKPVKTVILTHSDPDHVNGLASFPTGLTIIAQENNKKEQEAAISKGVYFAPPADHLPTKLVKDKADLTIDGIKLQLRHWAPAHTSGDLVVFVPAEKILFAGDLLTENSYPLIHLDKNGSSDGWISP